MDRGLYQTILRKSSVLLVKSIVFLVDRLRTQEAISKTWWWRHITIPLRFFWGVSKQKQQTTLLGGVPFASLISKPPPFYIGWSGLVDTSGEPQAPSFAKEVKKGDIPKDFVSFFETKKGSPKMVVIGLIFWGDGHKLFPAICGIYFL